MTNAENSPSETLIAAATVLLLRDTNPGVEVLMLKRNSKIAFGGMWVFPGGRVDADERTSDELASARAAAVRETHEEVGLVLPINDLVTWSHWQPPAAADMVTKGGPLRRFSTWFFAAPAPEGDVAIDHGEIHDDVWLSPQEALDRHSAGAIELVPPTWLTLWQLNAHQSVESALDMAATREPPRFWTKRLSKNPITLVWHGDAAYDSLDASVDGTRHRLVLGAEGWNYQNSMG